MAKLVQKSGYIKSEKAGGWLKYICPHGGGGEVDGNGTITPGK